MTQKEGISVFRVKRLLYMQSLGNRGNHGVGTCFEQRLVIFAVFASFRSQTENAENRGMMAGKWGNALPEEIWRHVLQMKSFQR